MKKRMIRFCVAAASAVAALCLILPVFAHTVTDSLWTGYIPATRSEEVPFTLTSDLLDSVPTTVIISKDELEADDSRAITVTLTASENVTAVISAVCPPDQALPEGKRFSVSAPETVDLTANVPATFDVTLETDVDETDYTAPASLSFSVSASVASKSVALGADFVMTVVADTSGHSGSITSAPEYFARGVPFVIEVGGPASVSFAADNVGSGGPFPAGTAYTVGGSRTVLYDGGRIRPGSACTVSIELPPACADTMIRLIAGSSSIQSFRTDPPAPVPDAAHTVQTDGQTAATLPLGFDLAWAGFSPTADFKRLTKENDVFRWSAATGFSCSEATGGEARITVPADALPGTYRVTLTYSVSSVELFSREIVFFVVGK